MTLAAGQQGGQGGAAHHGGVIGAAPRGLPPWAAPPDAACLSARSGQRVALAVSGANRVPTLPEVLTMAETGAKGYAAEFSLVMYAPRATPEAVVSCFRQAFVGGADDKPGPGGCRAWGRACADGAKAERCG